MKPTKNLFIFRDGLTGKETKIWAFSLKLARKVAGSLQILTQYWISGPLRADGHSFNPVLSPNAPKSHPIPILNR